MKYEIEPYVGVDNILFGMSSEVVRGIVGNEYKTFRKASSSQTKTDAYIGMGLHVHFDKEDKCEAVEFSFPAKPTLFDIEFIGSPFDAVMKEFNKIDLGIEVDDTGFISIQYGIGVFVPSLKDSLSQEIQGVIVFKRSYYD